MSNPTEITIRIKGDMQNYSQKFLCYDTVTLDPDESIIQQYIDEAKSNYKGEIESIIIKVHMEIS